MRTYDYKCEEEIALGTIQRLMKELTDPYAIHNAVAVVAEIVVYSVHCVMKFFRFVRGDES